MMAMVALVFAACQESNGDYRDVVYITGTMQKNTIRKGFEGADKVDLSITCTGKVNAPIKATFEAAPELPTTRPTTRVTSCLLHQHIASRMPTLPSSRVTLYPRRPD